MPKTGSLSRSVRLISSGAYGAICSPANAAATHLITFNIRDFGETPGDFGIQLCRPAELARRLRDGQE